MCGYFYTGFIDYMFMGKSLTDYTNLYIDKLDDIVHKYNNKTHRTIKMKPIDVKDNIYIDFGKEGNDNDPKFKVGDQCKNIKIQKHFCRGLYSKLV